MERVIEFSLNHPLLIGALFAVLAAIIANEIINFRRGRFAINTTEATQLYNRDAAVFVDIRNENAFQKSHLQAPSTSRLSISTSIRTASSALPTAVSLSTATPASAH